MPGDQARIWGGRPHYYELGKNVNVFIPSIPFWGKGKGGAS